MVLPWVKVLLTRPYECCPVWEGRHPCGRCSVCEDTALCCCLCDALPGCLFDAWGGHGEAVDDGVGLETSLVHAEDELTAKQAISEMDSQVKAQDERRKDFNTLNEERNVHNDEMAKKRRKRLEREATIRASFMTMLVLNFRELIIPCMTMLVTPLLHPSHPTPPIPDPKPC